MLIPTREIATSGSAILSSSPVLSGEGVAGADYLTRNEAFDEMFGSDEDSLCFFLAGRKGVGKSVLLNHLGLSLIHI